MRLSTSTNIFSERIGFPRPDQRECIKLCGEAGYRVMDFCFQDLMYSGSPFWEKDWDAYIDSVAVTAGACNIEFSQGHAIVYDFCRPDADHEFLTKIMSRCVKASGRLGIKWLVVHPSTDEGAADMAKSSRARNIAFFGGLLEHAVPLGLGIALENMWDLRKPPRRYCAAVEELVDLAGALGEGAGICWDVEHAGLMGQDQGAALNLIGKRLKAVHISDQCGPDNIHILPYLGLNNWDEIIEALARIDYAGDFTYELQWYLRRMPAELIPDSLRYSAAIGSHLVRQFETARSQFTGR